MDLERHSRYICIVSLHGAAYSKGRDVTAGAESLHVVDQVSPIAPSGALPKSHVLGWVASVKSNASQAVHRRAVEQEELQQRMLRALGGRHSKILEADQEGNISQSELQHSSLSI